MTAASEKMSYFKRKVLLIIIFFASYIGLVLRAHDLLSLSADKRQADSYSIPLLEYKMTLLSPNNQVEATLSKQSKDFLHDSKDITLSQNLLPASKHTGGDEVQNHPSVLKRLYSFEKVHIDARRRDSSSHTDYQRQRNATFVQVGEIYVYGAYLDLRQRGNFTVRILALKHKKLLDNLVCRFTDRGGKHIVLYAQAYRTSENHGKVYEGWIYSCLLPSTKLPLPKKISVFPVSHRQNHKSKLVAHLKLKTIPMETNPNAKHIGVCVPPIFGNLTLSSIVNFIQMCKVLGADQVFMYLGEVSWEIKKFLEFHSQSDTSLSLIDWHLPGNLSDSADKIWYHGQLQAVQDCLYTNMASFHFLLFMDLDEMLVPQNTNTWLEMLEEIFQTKDRDSVAALSFSSAFFDPTRVPEESESILYFQHVHRTRSVSKIRSKLMVQPLKVFELGVHHLSRAVSDRFQSTAVSEKTALLHHYRVCLTSYEPQMKCYPTIRDRRILRYKEKLTHLSHRIISDAFKLFA